MNGRVRQVGDQAADIRSNIGRPWAGSFVAVRAGKLVEIRLRPQACPDDVEAFSADVLRAVSRAGPGVVICADFRRGAPMSGPVASAWAREMRRGNQLVRRSAMLVDPSNTVFNLQVARVVRCAGSDDRRLFTEPRALYEFASQVLTESEREALKQLLAEMWPAALQA